MSKSYALRTDFTNTIKSALDMLTVCNSFILKGFVVVLLFLKLFHNVCIHINVSESNGLIR